MKAKKTLILLCFVMLATSCAYLTTKRETPFKNYTLNVEEQANISRPMIISGQTTYAGAQRRYGLAEEQDTWGSYEYSTNESLKEELIYSGRSDNIIRISYRQYKDIFSRPALSTEMAYDLNNSDIIIIRNFKIKILNATNEYIRFKVLED